MAQMADAMVKKFWIITTKIIPDILRDIIMV